MYPVIPALTRTVSNSFDFEGYRVPARSEILLGTTVGHHLPEYFPEPERFDIERYSPGRLEHQQPGAFAPFGVGQHRCIGSGLSELQIALTLAAIVREVGGRWAAFAALWTTALAYGAAVAVYQMGMLLRDPVTSAAWIVGLTLCFAAVVLLMRHLGRVPDRSPPLPMVAE